MINYLKTKSETDRQSDPQLANDTVLEATTADSSHGNATLKGQFTQITMSLLSLQRQSLSYYSSGI